MNEQQVINLFNKIKSANPGTKWTLEKLKEKLKTKETRKEFYENETYKTYLTSLGISLGDTLQEFESKYGPQNNTNNNTNKPKKQTSNITWNEVRFEREDVCKGQVIEEGMKGDIVWWIQYILNQHNPNFPAPDEKFGSGTKKEVTNFQLNNKDKLKPTGKVDKDTWNLLFAGSSHVCEKIENTSPEIKPEVKPTKVMPSKDKKPIKDLDIKSPENI